MDGTKGGRLIGKFLTKVTMFVVTGHEVMEFSSSPSRYRFFRMRKD